MKITKEIQAQAQELTQEIIIKSWEDLEFKNELIRDPLQTLKKLKGKTINLPENTSLVVEDQSDNNIIYLNIPRQVDLNDFELNDEQLELVSGGESPILITGLVIVTVLALKNLIPK